MNFFVQNSDFSSKFIFSYRTQFLLKIQIFFSSESWDIILYCSRIHLVNAPIFWRVSSFEASLTNKKFNFWIQIQKLARFSSLRVGWSFWHYHCKERPIFDLGLAWFAFITRKTTSTEKKPKKPFWRWDDPRCNIELTDKNGRLRWRAKRVIHGMMLLFRRVFEACTPAKSKTVCSDWTIIRLICCRSNP